MSHVQRYKEIERKIEQQRFEWKRLQVFLLEVEIQLSQRMKDLASLQKEVILFQEQKIQLKKQCANILHHIDLLQDEYDAEWYTPLVTITPPQCKTLKVTPSNTVSKK